ncbi:MAG: hypothetical protein LBC99_07965 [Spirochaetota bacterium]|jgi:hypothetical protein|nr:hypothetical protein [Spirochaetota bacterium]
MRAWSVLLILPCALVLLCTPGLRAEEAAATNVSPAQTTQAAQGAQKSAAELTEAALEKRVRALEAEVIKLWNYANTIRKSVPGENLIAGIADSRAALLINRYLGTGSDATRLPMLNSDGGVTLANIIVGEDRAEESVSTNGLRISCVVRGPQADGGNVFLAVYALPEADLVLRPEWLIHVDDAIPYINGIGQTRFIWHGNFADKTKAARGKYLIYARAIVSDSAEKSLGSAMRYWGARTADGSNANTVLIR